MHLKLQVPHYLSIESVCELIKYKLKDFISSNYYVKLAPGIPIRMFLMPEDTRSNIMVNVLLTGCKANPTFTYKLFT